ncbi:MAG: DNRLRE domain-containing protein, partial [bacterium]|nr:DNRLRE domain-containing protein [bacterium]
VHQVVGVDPVIAEATGQEYRNASSWDPFSGLYNDVPLAQNNIAPPEDTVNVSDTVGEYKEWTITKMASGWVSSPRDNHGLLINPDPNASEGSARYFRSSSHTDPAQRPRLVITCRTDRGQKLSWEDGSLVIWTDPSVTEHYVVQSAKDLGEVWKEESSVLSTPTWRSSSRDRSRRRFFRLQTEL